MTELTRGLNYVLYTFNVKLLVTKLAGSTKLTAEARPTDAAFNTISHLYPTANPPTHILLCSNSILTS